MDGNRVFQAVAELPMDLRTQLGYVRKKNVFDLNENIPLNLGFAGKWVSRAHYLCNDFFPLVGTGQSKQSFMVSVRAEGDCSNSRNPS
jgi:hypothetical protein